MATNKIYAHGNVIDHTNSTGSTITAGSIVVIGSLLGVAIADIEDGETGAVDLDGVYVLPKASAAVFAKGDEVIYDVSAGVLISTGAAEGDLVGGSVAWEAKGDGTTSVAVRLNVGPAAIQPPA